MVEWIFANIDKVLIAIGAAVVLFWPKIQEQLAALQSGGGDKPASNGDTHTHNHCPCCCVPEPVQEKTRTEWVADVMAVRIYVDKRKLPDAVAACDTLIHEIVSGRPQIEGASVTVAKVAR